MYIDRAHYRAVHGRKPQRSSNGGVPHMFASSTYIYRMIVWLTFTDGFDKKKKTIDFNKQSIYVYINCQ